MSRRKHCSCNNCNNCCGRNNCCEGLGSFPNLFSSLGCGISPFNGCSNNSLLMLLLLSSLMNRE